MLYKDETQIKNLSYDPFAHISYFVHKRGMTPDSYTYRDRTSVLHISVIV